MTDMLLMEDRKGIISRVYSNYYNPHMMLPNFPAEEGGKKI